MNLLDPILPQRFWDKVRLCRGSGCWVWLAYRDPKGYGSFKWLGRWTKAHHVALLALGTQITDQVDHTCTNTSCVNPAHLEPVTNAENMRRRYARMTHCKHGHPMSEAYVENRGGRNCRTCQRLRTAKWAAQ
jgi:hypothetical protein